MLAGSLFSGCGLADYGLHQAGFELAWACEIEKQPRAVLRRHFPRAEIHFDVKEMAGGTLKPVDLLFFGSPCQDLSVAGKRAGLAGERSGLFAEAMRIVDEMDAPPRICVWENVCGALSSNKGADFATVLTEMGKRWSGVAYRVLDLQWFGVPQRRRRVFVVGHSGGWRSAAEILFEREGLRRNPPSRRKAGKGGAGGVAGCLRSGSTSPASHGKLNGSDRQCMIPVGFNNTGQGWWNEADQAATVRKGDRASGSSPCVAFHENQRAECTLSPTAWSLKAGGGKPGQGYPAVISATQVRRLTCVECERLMGAPDGYTVWGIDDNGKRVEMADGQRYKMIGNGVGVPHSRWIGKRIVEQLSGIDDLLF